MRLRGFMMLILIVGSVTGCKKETLQNSYEIPGDANERYLIVRGQSLRSPITKLEDYGNLAFPNPEMEYAFEVDVLGDWTVFRFPGAESHWMFHNIAFWFLGFGADDPNYADQVIGIALGPDADSGYLLFGDNSEDRPVDSLYGLSQGGDRFLVNIPFDVYSEERNFSWNGVMKELTSIGIEDPFEAFPLASPKTVTVTFYHSLDQRPPM